MRGPSWRGDQVPAGVGLIHGQGFILAAGSGNLGAHCRVTTARFPPEDPGRGQDLGGMADGSNGLVRVREVAHDFEDTRVEPKVFRRSASGKYERVVLIRLGLVEVRIQREVVTSLFAIGLVALEVVNCRPPASSDRRCGPCAQP